MENMSESRVPDRVLLVFSFRGRVGAGPFLQRVLQAACRESSATYLRTEHLSASVGEWLCTSWSRSPRNSEDPAQNPKTPRPLVENPKEGGTAQDEVDL